MIRKARVRTRLDSQLSQIHSENPERGVWMAILHYLIGIGKRDA